MYLIDFTISYRLVIFLKECQIDQEFIKQEIESLFKVQNVFKKKL